MKLYNTLTRSIDDFKPRKPPEVKVYTCGPTVYDTAHVGHWFNYVRMDVLIRTLKGAGYTPNWVMNITDVGHLTSDADEGEDKLEKGARREGKTAWEIAAFYTDDFLQGMRALNILTPDYIVKATDHISDQIDLIKILETKGYTYTINDGVYYDTSKFPTYEDFARLDTSEQEAGKRVSFNPEKRNLADFALWKFTPEGTHRDMEWDSPWGKGFPGWHIECSAMSMKYLGPTLDIHTGGIDHIPVHHTNEIAQSEAATGKRFAHYWFHSNHVMINGEKISKSLGNGISLQQIIDHGFSPQVLRLHILESHYRSQSKFSWDSLAAAANRLRDLRAMAVLRWQVRPVTHDASTFAFEDVPLELQTNLEQDVNTPQALAYLSYASTQLQTVQIEDNMLDHFVNMLQGIDELLGLELMAVPDINNLQKQLISEREAARGLKDWAHADSLRKQLIEQDIIVRDTEQAVIWSWSR
jgi:cysteinyl-tRNA synthetase